MTKHIPGPLRETKGCIVKLDMRDDQIWEASKYEKRVTMRTSKHNRDKELRETRNYEKWERQRRENMRDEQTRNTHVIRHTMRQTWIKLMSRCDGPCRQPSSSLSPQHPPRVHPRAWSQWRPASSASAKQQGPHCTYGTLAGPMANRVWRPDKGSKMRVYPLNWARRY